jgi:enoyl-CoA hydratase/carnithine racemase
VIESVTAAQPADHWPFGAVACDLRCMDTRTGRCDGAGTTKSPARIEREMADTTSKAPTIAVGYELRGSAAWLRLQRPEKMNAIDPDVIAGLTSGLASALSDGARVVVITGSGGVFCAGADLKHVLRGLDDLSAIEGLLASAEELMCAIERHPAPVIAAVNGAAIAGGFEIVLACDLVVAAEDAVLADGHVRYGLFPGGGSTARLPRIVGPTRAKHLLLTGRTATAAEMLQFGVVNEVVPAEELDAAVSDLCERLARGSSAAQARMKRVVGDGLDLPLAKALELELEVAKEHLRSADVAEGLAAFSEGRRPDFAASTEAAV